MTLQLLDTHVEVFLLLIPNSMETHWHVCAFKTLIQLIFADRRFFEVEVVDKIPDSVNWRHFEFFCSHDYAFFTTSKIETDLNLCIERDGKLLILNVEQIEATKRVI